jgi:hypothetical protein
MNRIVFLLEEYSMKAFLEELLPRLFPSLQKVSGARRMGARLRRETNSSRSFQALVEGIEQLVAGGAS